MKPVRKKIEIVYLSAIAIAPLVLLLLPANFFDNGRPICLSVVLFDQKCFGCGMTRAVQHLIHLEYKEAINFNKLSIIVTPLLAVLWWMEVKRLRTILKSLQIK